MGRRRKRGADVHGVVLVDKPAGMTSHDVVAVLRRAYGTSRIGHTGTLDPAATGLLVVCVGDMTRFASRLTGMDKRYRGELALGASTTTDDAEGDVVYEGEVTPAALREACAALVAMVGPLEQRPPAVSAIRVNGVRAHQLVREGHDVEIPSRQVEIFDVQVVDASGSAVVFDAHVSKGTYIRSMARDAGERAGCFGHLRALRRTSVGGYEVASAVSLSELARPRRDEPPLDEGAESARLEACKRALISPWESLSFLPALSVDAAQRSALRMGQRPPCDARAGEYRVADEAGALLGVVRVVEGDVPHVEVVRLCPTPPTAPPPQG